MPKPRTPTPEPEEEEPEYDGEWAEALYDYKSTVRFFAGGFLQAVLMLYITF